MTSIKQRSCLQPEENLKFLWLTFFLFNIEISRHPFVAFVRSYSLRLPLHTLRSWRKEGTMWKDRFYIWVTFWSHRSLKLMQKRFLAFARSWRGVERKGLLPNHWRGKYLIRETFNVRSLLYIFLSPFLFFINRSAFSWVHGWRSQAKRAGCLWKLISLKTHFEV